MPKRPRRQLEYYCSWKMNAFSLYNTEPANEINNTDPSTLNPCKTAVRGYLDLLDKYFKRNNPSYDDFLSDYTDVRQVSGGSIHSANGVDKNGEFYDFDGRANLSDGPGRKVKVSVRIHWATHKEVTYNDPVWPTVKWIQGVASLV